MDPQDIVEFDGNGQLAEAIAKLIEMDKWITKLEGRMNIVEFGLIHIQNMVNNMYYTLGYKPESEEVRDHLREAKQLMKTWQGRWQSLSRWRKSMLL